MTKRKKNKDKISSLEVFKNLKHNWCFLFAIAMAICLVTVDAACSGTQYTQNSICVTCPVNYSCNGSSKSSCTSTSSWAALGAGSCSSVASGKISAAGTLFNCPSHLRGVSGSCNACASKYSCNGSNTQTRCSTTSSSYQVAHDGKCYSCPSDFECTSNQVITSLTKPGVGQYVSNNNVVTCSAGSFCINGETTSCGSTGWTYAGQGVCGKYIVNHLVLSNSAPGSCNNGQYMANPFTSTS